MPRITLKHLHEHQLSMQKTLDKLLKGQSKIMATEKEIFAEITKQTTIVDGIAVLVKELREIATSSGTPEERTKAFDEATRNTAKLAGALTENTDDDVP